MKRRRTNESLFCFLVLSFGFLCASSYKDQGLSMMGDDFPSDLAQWSLQKNLHATEDLKLNLGCAIEVLWEVSASPEEEAPAAETSTSEEKMKSVVSKHG